MASANINAKKRREIKNNQNLPQAALPSIDISAEGNNYHRKNQSGPAAEKLPFVVKVEDKKKYLLESLLIVFSVLLALSLNELRAYWQDKKQTRELLTNIEVELAGNKELAQFQQTYHQQVLKNIDSALAYPVFRERIFQGNDFKISLLTSEGIVARGPFSETAWNIAKNNNILAKTDLTLITQLTDIYFQQQMIATGFDELKVLYVDRESQKLENAEQTLKLMKKIYRAYITDRTPYMIRDYEKVINEINE